MARKTIEQIDASLARWQTRLKRAVNAIEKLQKQKKRMQVKASVQRMVEKAVPKPPPVAATLPAPAASPPDLAVAPPLAKAVAKTIDTGIPAFLKREKPGTAVAEQIAAEQAERKRLKAKGRIAKLKAKQSGETKRMPLTGRAALEAIRNG